MNNGGFVEIARRKISDAFYRSKVKKRQIDWSRDLGDPPEKIECFANRGVWLPVVPSITSEAISAAIRLGCYEAQEAAFLEWLIQEEEIILEIGGGCGFISTYCAKNPHTKAVYCVEANPNLIEVIKLTHRLNNVNVSIFNEVLSKQDGETDFYLHEDFWASGTHSSLGKPIKVKTTSFQRRFDAIRPTMLIVDIEGGEESLFEEVDLTGVRKILIELHPPVIGNGGIKKIFDLLSNQGFHYDAWFSTYWIVTFSHLGRA